MKTALSMALLLALAAPAAAQENDKPASPGAMSSESGSPEPVPSGETPSPSEKCRVEPERQDGEKNPKPEAGNQNLTQKLDPCGGILKPPAVGDDEMTAPAPDEGRTPVIKPGEIPTQPQAK